MEKTPVAFLSSRAKIGLFIAFATVCSIGSSGAPTDAFPNDSDIVQEAEIEKLTVCYARGTDAIGRGDLAGGKNIYKNCFTNNAELSVWFPGADFNGPPDFVTTGTDSWANFVEATFTGNGYIATQHLMGSVSVEVTGNHAHMVSYLHATHVLANGTIDVANGTYDDEVVRVMGKWRIKRRTLKLIDFLNLGTPVP